MDTRQFFYGQPVTETEMIEIFNLVEDGIGNVVADVTGQLGTEGGVCGTSMVPYAATPADNTVKIPVGCAYADEVNGTSHKVPSRWAAIQTIDCSVDYLAATTEPGAGKERYLSIFVKFVRAESDPKTDLHGNPLNYDQDEDYEFEVHQTADANPGTATPVAIPGTNYTRIADIRVTVATWGTISDPVDPENPGDDEIDYTGVTYLGTAEVREARGAYRTLTESVDSKAVSGVRRQAIVNGNFNLWQRGTAAATIGAGIFLTDRFFAAETLAVGTATVERATDAPTFAESGANSVYSNKVLVTGADATVAAGEVAYIRYCVEGYDFAQIKGGYVTLSFWVKSDCTGTFCVAFQNNAKTRSYVAEYTIDVAATWEKKTITVRLDEAGGVWEVGNATGLRILWALAVGSTYQTTKDAWQTGEYLGTASQVNLFDATNYIEIAQVQLCAGREALPFLVPTISEEIAKAQRYYEKSYDIGIAPASVADRRGAFEFVACITGDDYKTIVYKNRKRSAAPTIAVYCPVGHGTAAKAHDLSAGTDVANVTGADNGDFSFVAHVTVTDGHPYTFQWTAESELT